MFEQNATPTWTETDRIAALHSYSILDTPPEQAFDEIVQLAGTLLGAPIAAINLIDAHRQWFKSEVGLGVREMPLDDSICKFVLLESERMVVADTLEDERFRCNPLVTSGPGLRFYAGELLKTAEGFPLGTLCILDTEPRPEGLTAVEAQTLRTLAHQVLTQLELRKLVHEQQTSIAEQTRMQVELLRAQERTGLATEAAGLGIWSWDSANDTVIWENRRTFEIFGLAPSEPPVNAARFVNEFVHPSDGEAFGQAVALTIETGARFSFEGRIYRRDGELRWIDLFGISQGTGDGDRSRILGAISDITDRKLSELALYESRNRFENIVKQAATGVVQADTDGRIIAVNDKFCEMIGYTREELLAMKVLDVTAPSSTVATKATLDKVAAGTAGAVMQKEYRKKDGSLMWATSSVSAVNDSEGVLQGLVAIIVDVTQSRASEERLRVLAADLSEADRRKSEFLATLAHELRNPLAPISSGLAVLKLGADNPAMVQKIRPMLERQVGQMVHLIDDLLDVARISSGKIELKKSQCDLNAIVASALEISLPMIERASHTLVVNRSDELLMLDADSARLTQVFANLFNNAAKYTPSAGTIEIAIRKDDRQAVVTVTDNGVGISSENIAGIFLMFNQVRDNMSRAQGGLGVGLSLVKRLVEMHSGSVTVASAGIGKGSKFSVRLPLSPNESGTVDAVPERSTPKQGAVRVLIADDNEDTADVMAEMLGMLEHSTRVANDGVQAMRIAEEFRPQVMFLDLGMPEMNGYEVAQAVRNSPHLEDIILVALTGWGNESDRVKSKPAGFDFHLTKPADMGAIITVLDSIAKMSAAPMPNESDGRTG